MNPFARIARWFRVRRRARVEAIFDLCQPMSVYAPSRRSLEAVRWNVEMRRQRETIKWQIAELRKLEVMVNGDFDSPPEVFS